MSQQNMGVPQPGSHPSSGSDRGDSSRRSSFDAMSSVPDQSAYGSYTTQEVSYGQYQLFQATNGLQNPSGIESGNMYDNQRSMYTELHSTASIPEGPKSTSSPPPPPRVYKPCVVCHDKSSGYHYGVSSCEGCKGFFRRSVQKNMQYTCHKEKNCTVNKVTRNRCQYCRLQKCFAMGMSKEAVRNDRNKKRKQKPESTSTNDLTEDEQTLITDILDAHIATSSCSANASPMVSHSGSTTASPMSSTSTTVCEDPCIGLWDNTNELSSEAIVKIVDFAKKIPGFVDLSTSDQITLLKAACLEVMILRLCAKYDPDTDRMVFKNGATMDRDQVNEGGLGSLTSTIFSFARALKLLHVDEREFAMLSAVCLISGDRSGLSEVAKIEKMQENLLEALKHYMRSRRQDQPYVFAKLLMKLTDLRSISVKGVQEQLFSPFHKSLDNWEEQAIRNHSQHASSMDSTSQQGLLPRASPLAMRRFGNILPVFTPSSGGHCPPAAYGESSSSGQFVDRKPQILREERGHPWHSRFMFTPDEYVKYAKKCGSGEFNASAAAELNKALEKGGTLSEEVVKEHIAQAKWGSHNNHHGASTSTATSSSDIPAILTKALDSPMVDSPQAACENYFANVLATAPLLPLAECTEPDSSLFAALGQGESTTDLLSAWSSLAPGPPLSIEPPLSAVASLSTEHPLSTVAGSMQVEDAMGDSVMNYMYTTPLTTALPTWMMTSSAMTSTGQESPGFMTQLSQLTPTFPSGFPTIKKEPELAAPMYRARSSLQGLLVPTVSSSANNHALPRGMLLGQLGGQHGGGGGQTDLLEMPGSSSMLAPLDALRNNGERVTSEAFSRIIGVALSDAND